MTELELLIAHNENNTVMLFDTRRAFLGAQPVSGGGTIVQTAESLKNCITREVKAVSGYTLIGFVEAKNGRRVYGVLEKRIPNLFVRLFGKKKIPPTARLP